MMITRLSSLRHDGPLEPAQPKARSIRDAQRSSARDEASLDVAARDAITMGAVVERALQRRFPRLGTDEVHDAVMDALLAEACQYGRHDWTSLEWRYVYRAAFCNASNMAASVCARESREQRWSAQSSEFASSGESPGQTTLERTAELRAACQTISQLLPDRKMQIVFGLWASGERDTAAFAAALDLKAASQADQRAMVRREKDRLRKYLRRSQAIAEVALNALRSVGVD